MEKKAPNEVEVAAEKNKEGEEIEKAAQSRMKIIELPYNLKDC